ncbi:conserved exported hypothetical protein [anaerobic digester metagenome]|jgi:hypothetical protein|uniref:LPS-assembly protein LptD n=1 Tax=anaerobic digester metagenome TaxID=1263854 RepID=A0A485M9Z8_9ZZZZ
MRRPFILLTAAFFSGVWALTGTPFGTPAYAHDLLLPAVQRMGSEHLQNGMTYPASIPTETAVKKTASDLSAWHLESQRRPVLDSNSFRFQTYMLQHEQENIRATVGDVNIHSSELIAPSLSRKGALLGVRKDGYTAEAFTTRADPMQGFRSGLKQPDADRILMGGRVTRTLFKDRDVRFTFHYLDSRNAGAFSSSATSEASYREGTAYSSALEGSIFGNLLRFAGEYCYSRYDDPSVTEQTMGDRAWRIGLSGATQRFSYALGYKLLGEDFHTIASPYALNDREELSMDTQYLFDSSCASFSVLQSRTSVENDLLPVTISRTGKIGYKFAPAGWPVLFVSQSLSTRRSADEHADPASVVDSMARTTYFSISYKKGAFDLAPSYSISRFMDRARPAGDYDSLTHTVRVACGISPGQWLSVSPVFTYRNCLMEEPDIRVRAYQGSLTGTVQIIPGMLTIDTMVSYMEKEASDDSTSLSEKKAAYRLNWHIEKYLRNMGARSLAFMGEFMHTDDHAGNVAVRDYTISLVASIGLPADLLDYQSLSSRFPREARELPF